MLGKDIVNKIFVVMIFIIFNIAGYSFFLRTDFILVMPFITVLSVAVVVNFLLGKFNYKNLISKRRNEDD